MGVESYAAFKANPGSLKKLHTNSALTDQKLFAGEPIEQKPLIETNEWLTNAMESWLKVMETWFFNLLKSFNLNLQNHFAYPLTMENVWVKFSMISFLLKHG